MKQLLLLASAALVLLASCSKNDEGSPSTGTASLTISLVGSNKVYPSAVGTPTQTEENEIHSFYVYVFTNNRLEKVSYVNSGLSYTMNNLTTGAKRVVVVANPPSGFPTLVKGDYYGDLSIAASRISLSDQVDLTNGLVMSGEVSTTLAALPTVNSVSIHISRVVAKIKLGTVTIDPAPGSDPLLFDLQAVAIVKAKSLSTVGVPNVTTYEPFYSGVASITVPPENVRPFLYESITEADHDNRFFYLFPNDNTDNNATLITLVATYNGETVFYPFRIDSPTGSYIQRNTQHTINITLRRLSAGSPDPDTPSDPATLTVTIIPEDWVVVPVQNEEW